MSESEAVRQPTVVVAGDVMIDWNLTVDRDVSVAPRSWREAGKVHRVRQRGGAWMLTDLVKEFAAAAQTPGNWQVFGVAEPNAAQRGDVHQTHSVVAVYPPISPSRDRILRIKDFLGIERGVDLDLPLEKDDPLAEIVVLLDSDLGFEKKKIGKLPAALTVERERPPWVILKTSVPDFQGPLWRHLMRRHASRLIVVLNVDDLRHKELQLIRRVSWERTAQDVVSEIEQSDALRSLRRSRYVIVSFGAAGAMLLPRGELPQLVFDPAAMEGEWEPGDRGRMIGNTTVLAAAVAQEVMRHPAAPQLIDALPRGIAGIRALFTTGFGTKNSSPSLNIAAIVKAAFEKQKIVSTATVRSEGKSWTILEERLRAATEVSPEKNVEDVLYEMASRVAIYGPDHALADVPQLRIEKLFAVDRDEIESIRTVKALLTEYVDRKPSKPLSIAVFGTPGSGKSFAVKQIAEAIGRTKIETLTFNLTQFARSDDLHGAFHQVRDVSLRGKIPIVFWDEFDTTYDDQELGWLRYFIGPMQDGEFQEAQITHPIGTSIFVFAGGTATSKSEFSKDATTPARKARKVPDFISRLKGFLNVTGPNRRDESDQHFLVRRAILLRTMLESHCKDLFTVDGMLRIDPGVLHAFLNTTSYLHGARSLESVIAMSTLAGRKHFDSSSLPPESQLGLHVELPFESLAYEFAFTHDVVRLERLAQEAHQVFCDVRTKHKWEYAEQRDDKNRKHNLLVEYAKLPEHEKEANRAHIRWIPRKLATEGFEIAPAGSGKMARMTGAEVLRLAKLEHQIWMDRKLANGYAQGEASESPKRNPYLKPWEELDQETRDMDEELIRAIPRILALADFILVRRGQ